MKKIILLMLILLFSCEDEGIAPNYGCTDVNAANYDADSNVDDDSCILSLTWTDDIKEIFTLCIDCHFELKENYSSINNSGMIDDLNPETNDMFRRINIEDVNDFEFMPQSYDPLSNTDIEKIRAWLLIGAPE